MSYAMRKTPRSSFMGDVTATVTSPAIMSPPFVPPGAGTAIIPSGTLPPTPAPTAVMPLATQPASSGLGRYVLGGGIAYLAYWLWSKE